jgi:hypothetical protein
MTRFRHGFLLEGDQIEEMMVLQVMDVVMTSCW